jgi:hypothetical protein
MNKLQFFLWLFFIPLISIKGQNFIKEFGKIGQDEIELAQYSKDKNAEALVLFDIGKSYFLKVANSFEIIFERMTRIKVFSESGIKWSEIEIPYYQEGGIFEEVYDIEACSYNFENGIINKTNLDIANTYDEKVNDFWNMKKFVLPNVKAGSIIEYKYKISSQFFFNLRDWKFQWKIPVLYSEYEVKMVPFYEYSFLLQGANKFDYQTSYVERDVYHQFGQTRYHNMVHKYVMMDIPAFYDEEYISSVNDYIIKLDIQLSKIIYTYDTATDVITTWEALITDLLKHNHFGKYVIKSEKLTSKLINTDSLLNKNNKEKFDFILKYAKINYSWNKKNDKYATKSPGKFVTDKYGNCAEINLFVVGMLNGAGIEAYPVLISTRDHGKIRVDYPYSHFFNYVLILANIDGKQVLSDATEVLGLNDRIPVRCINDKGLIINKEKVKWLDLECTIPSETVTEIKINLSGLYLNADIIKTATEYDALYFRNLYGNNTRNIAEKLFLNGYKLIDSSITVQNQFEIKKPYILSYNLTGKPDIINNKLWCLYTSLHKKEIKY